MTAAQRAAHTPTHVALDAAGIVELFGIADRHPNALTYHLTRANKADLNSLVYDGAASVALATLAFSEIDRREIAMKRLLADCPGFARAMAARQ